FTHIRIPASVESIGECAFSKDTYYSGYTGDYTGDYTKLYTAFIEVAEGNEYYSSDEYGVLYNKDKTVLIQYPAGSKADSFDIPDTVREIVAYAFAYADSLVSVTIPETVTVLGNRAFAYSQVLDNVIIPDGVTALENTFQFGHSLANVTIGAGVKEINKFTFSSCYALDSITVDEDNPYYSSDEYGVLYNKEKTQLIKYPVANSRSSFTVPDTITKIAYHAFYYCRELESVTLPVSVTLIDLGAFGHCQHITDVYYGGNESDWAGIDIKDGNDYLTNAQVHFTHRPSITVDNYTVTITEADYIRDIRYALGIYSTPSEIKAAEGNVPLSNDIVTKNTFDGEFIYKMPDGGVYSFWIRMKDGTNYIHTVEMTDFVPTVDVYGVKITVNNLYGAKDFFIAKGEYGSYNEIKENGYIVRVTDKKMAGKHSYTYTVTDPGMHTVLVRYNDGSEYIFHEELVVDEPVFETNGLQVIVKNIPDVKVIRTAYGEYYTPGDTKRAEGARNFSGKSAIKDAEEYLLQYRNEGRVTIIVEYNNGYIKVFHYDVVKKTPEIKQEGNSIIVNGLDGLYVLRYAKGEYSSAQEIKRAPGSGFVRGSELVDETFEIKGLEYGATYTVYVQYDDESYSYNMITVTE
ncbi:MAG: leucine-rich repeat domain-containing protein, partial [Clostridia bacterium]|nr:leucine-rich repeat domain-containing protein [Clostridia bacterium]